MKILTLRSRIDWVGNLTALQLDELLFHLFEKFLLKKKAWNKENNHSWRYSGPYEVIFKLCIKEWLDFQQIDWVQRMFQEAGILCTEEHGTERQNTFRDQHIVQYHRGLGHLHK